jgi:hypothetical protein
MPGSARPRAVFVALTLENDISVYDCPRGRAPATAPADWNHDPDEGGLSRAAIKIWLTDHSALYNLVAIAAKRVDALERALMAIGLVARPHTAHGGDPGPSAIERTADELAWLAQNVPAGAPFAVLLVPSRFDVRDRDPAHIGQRKAIAAALARRGLAVVDPAPALEAAGFARVHFPHDGHWTALGHEVAGKAAAAWLAGALKVTAAP